MIFVHPGAADAEKRRVQGADGQIRLFSQDCDLPLQIEHGVIGAVHNIGFRIYNAAGLSDPVAGFSGKGQHQTAGLHEGAFLLGRKGQLRENVLLPEGQAQKNLPAVAIAFPAGPRAIAQGQGAAGNAVPGKGGVIGFVITVGVVLPAVVLDSPGGKVVAVASQKFIDVPEAPAVIAVGKGPLLPRFQQGRFQPVIIQPADPAGFRMEPEGIPAAGRLYFLPAGPKLQRLRLSFRQGHGAHPFFNLVQRVRYQTGPGRLLLPGFFHKPATVRCLLGQELLFLIGPVRAQPGFHIGAPCMLAEKGHRLIIPVPQRLQGGVPGLPPAEAFKGGAVNPSGPLPAFPHQADLGRVGADTVNPGVRQVAFDDGQARQVTAFHFPVKIIHCAADDLRLRTGRPGLLRHFPDEAGALGAAVVVGMHQSHPDRVLPVLGRKQARSVAAPAVHGQHSAPRRAFPEEQLRHLGRSGKLIAAQV